MNTAQNNGGPAFPCQEFGTVAGANTQLAPGMTLRDWFAGQALQLAGAYAISMVLGGKTPPMNEDDMARRAYRTADAMLAQREL